MKKLLVPLFLAMFLLACAGLTPPVPGVPEAEYEKGLRFSEQEFFKPIDILQGVWNPADSNLVKRPIEEARNPERSGFRIQIISLGSEAKAQSFRNQMQRQFPHTQFWVLRRGKYWAVQVGPFPTRKAADQALRTIWRSKFPDAWIVRSP